MPIVDNELVNDRPMEEMAKPNQTIGEYLLSNVQNNISKFGDGTWLHDSSTGQSMKYSEMATGIIKVASALRKRGLKTGDFALVMASNFVELPVAMLGIMKAGGSCASLTLNLFVEDIRKRATLVRAKFVVTDQLRAERVLNAVRDLDFVEQVFVIGQAPGCTPIDELLTDDGKECPERLEVDLDACAWLMFSSGTTGEPKGIVQTHRTLILLLETRKLMPTPGLTALFINYIINSGGVSICLLFSLAHINMVTISNYDDFNLLETISKVQPFLISIFPCQLASICRHPNLEQFQLKSVAVVVCYGSTIYPKYEREIFDKLPSMILLNVGFGMSESLSITAGVFPPVEQLMSFTKEKAIENHVFGSSGKVVYFTKVKIIDETTGEKLGPNQIGEICAHSPFTMKEYLNNPKATAETIQDGWIHTGDKGYYDTDEHLFVIGRFKELIKYRMAHVVPTNIEKQMMTHPAVEEVGVVGQPHEEDGERPLAFVVLRKGATATAEELVDYTNGLVIEEEKLRAGVRFIDEIPRNELGKIIRPKLSKLL